MVLSGGGALGAFQAGAIRALHEAGLEFEVISATSIGTMNALAWNIPEVLEEFDEHWLENVRRLRPFDLARILSGKNPFQFHKSLETIADTYRGRYPWDQQRTEVLVTLTDYERNTRWSSPLVMSG
jgi:predicted acylesterase/phospholipase RssA